MTRTELNFHLTVFAVANVVVAVVYFLAAVVAAEVNVGVVDVIVVVVAVVAVVVVEVDGGLSDHLADGVSFH
jgi:hypothetical protein